MPDFQWDRVEPHTRSEDLEEGLQARIADPLWMLGRQWQLGEFRGEDAASAVHARVRAFWNPLETFRNDAIANGSVEPMASDTPLEARVEAEGAINGPARLTLAAEAGLQFSRRLEAAGLGGLRSKFRDKFPLVVDPEVIEGLPERHRIRLELLARRAIDGRLLYAASTARVKQVAGSASAAAAVVAPFKAWREEYLGRLEEPGDSGDTWADERLEYSFSIGVSAGQGEVVLSAEEYTGGALDWHSFDVDGSEASSHGLGAGTPQSKTLDLLPVPLTYAGMPASRWWEFEEGSVYFGGIEAGPADIGRLVVAEYATVYSDDWLLLPVRLPVGSLARIQRITILDTFGGEHEIESTASNDADGSIATRPWAYFELAGDTSASEGRTPWLLIPPALVGPLNGKPVEEVSFVRDEGANLGWAIESTIEAPTGAAVSRRLQWGLAQQANFEKDSTAEVPEAGTSADDNDGTEDGATEADAPWAYRLQTEIPPYWIPLVPEPIEPGSAEVRLRRARMLAWDQIEAEWAKGPKGEVLAPTRALRLFEEEVPKGGVQVTRAWQLARGSDGSVHLWMARRKRPGRGGRASGLEFDKMER